MLIEIKVKVAKIIDGKARKRMETFLIDREFFSEAEYAVTSSLNNELNEGTVSNFEIQSLRISPIREIATQFTGEWSFITTLTDIFLQDDGTEKKIRYKVLLWANSLTEANSCVSQLSHQGYDMQVESIKQVDYEYLTVTSENTNNEEEHNSGQE